MKKIQINSISYISVEDMYVANKYPGLGFYEVCGNVVFVSKENFVVFICLISEIDIIQNKDDEKSFNPNYQKNLITEDFVLKLLAITANKEKFNELKPKNKL